MPINKKSFKTLEPIFFETPDKDTEMVKETFSTSQGLTLNKYKLFENLNDLKVKNFSVNVLTDEVDYNDFYKYDLGKNFQFLDYNTSIAFNALNDLSASSFLSFDRSKNFNSSLTNIDFYGGGDDQSFVLDFIDDKLCTIKAIDNGIIKFLTVMEEESNDIKFTSLTNNYISTSSFMFEYDFDKTNLFITLFKTLTGGGFKVLAPLSGSLSLETPTNSSVDAGTIKISDQQATITKDDLNSFIFYDKEHNISNETLKNQKNNYIGWYPYEITALSGDVSEGQSQRFINVIDFMNLRNQVSNDNFVNPVLPLSGNQVSQKKYSSLLNVDNKEFENEEMLLGYNFFTKEYNFLPDKYTKFTLPDSLFPYRRLNINDSNLSKAGAYAGDSPYFSDKVFKRVDRNKNVNDKTRIEGALFNESSLPISLQDTNNVLQLQEVVFDSINNGTVLCSWLSGDENVKGTWYDRYYIPQSTNYTTALTGTGVPVFDNIRQALSFFDNRGIDQTYYDVKSNLSFEPQSTLYYQRIGHNYINETINNFDDYLVKSTFNNIFSGQVLEERDKLIFSSHSYDYIDVDTDINNNQFNVSFDLNLDSPTSLDSYQIFGNKFEDVFSLKNNFYFTPFVYLADGNNIFVYDSKFNLIQTNTYPTLTGISDILYLEQGSNFIIIGRAPENDVIIKSSFTGRVLDERRSSSIDPDQSPNEILAGYKSRYIYGSNQVVFNMETPTKTYYLNLNSLQISTSATALGLANSVLKAGDNLKSVPGFGAVKLTDDIAVSLSAVDHPGYDTLNYINMSNGESLYNPISAFKKIFIVFNHTTIFYMYKVLIV